MLKENWLLNRRSLASILKEVQELESRAYATSLVVEDYRCSSDRKPEGLEAILGSDGVLRVESEKERLMRENVKYVQKMISKIPVELEESIVDVSRLRLTKK